MLIRFKRLFSTDKIIEKTREIMDNMLMDLNRNAERNVGLVNDSIKMLKDVQEEIRTIYKGLKNITVADKSEMSITDCYHFVAFTFEDGTSYGYRFEGTGLLVYGSDNYDISGGGDLFGYMQEKCTSEQ